MLGLWDRNDPTPPIRLSIGGVGPFVGVFWIVYGAIRIGSSFWDGLLFLLGGAVFVAIGIARVVAWRRSLRVSSTALAPRNDGGTADRP